MRLVEHQHGQTMVVVALGIVGVLVAAALAVDWGYGLTQRRSAQNAADAAALAAGRLLATETRLVDGDIVFAPTQYETFCYAKSFADANSSFAASDARRTLTLQYGDASGAFVPSASPSSCPSAPPFPQGGGQVPATTSYVRAAVSTTYTSFFAGLAGQRAITAAASARARIAGVPEGAGPVWPMVRHYDPAEFNEGSQCTGNPCDPRKIKPMVFWTGQGSLPNMVYGSFKGLVDYSRYSTRYEGPNDDPIGQLMTGWDKSGSPEAGTPKKADESGNCAGGWDTQGDENPQQQDKQCSIPNWFYWAFGGGLSLDESWQNLPNPPDEWKYAELPQDIGSRRSTVCNQVPSGLEAPSCAAPYKAGDWIETASGDIGQNNAILMDAFIEAHGQTDIFSSDRVPGGGNATFGKKVTIYVYLWDCAETFNSSGRPGNEWSLIPGNGDCSQLPTNAGTPDRVHVFTVAPFTFYKGLVSGSSIEGYWGGGWGDPTTCQADPSTCLPIGIFNNTAFLVPDE